MHSSIFSVICERICLFTSGALSRIVQLALKMTRADVNFCAVTSAVFVPDLHLVDGVVVVALKSQKAVHSLSMENSIFTCLYCLEKKLPIV
eukprot:m.195528 g.195528  ORF g.195528 m.195528 type:complete len:91 (+) comp39517_c0_seq85:3363-3635(+)